ncbi:MAG: calcium-binding protein [Inquilinus sp.]|uniref:calcium-binding protein n=1 Tax=Inquilinus sp. TaxID=1932117 RepID=UPI003F3CBFF8
MAIINGTPDDDVFAGDGENDTINGLGGNDVLPGNGGDDELNGGDGNDELYGGGGSNTLSGGGSDDQVTVTRTFSDPASVDVADGGAGADTLIVDFAGSGLQLTFSLNGVSSDGSISSSNFEALAYSGGSGNDIVTSAAGSDQLFGYAGNDTLVGAAGADQLDGGDGNDVLRGGAGADAIDGGTGIDTASYYYATTGVSIDLGAHTASGGEAQGDVLTGIENLTGGQANDSLAGDAGANVLAGWNGNDVLRGGTGADKLDGGAGIDTASYYTGATGVVVSLASNTGSGGEAQGDTLSGIENLSGGQGWDQLYGNAGANVLQGWNGNDLLVGRAGQDTLTGGAGADRFQFTAVGDSVVGTNADRITDFSRAQGDKIDLSGIDANTGAAGNQAFSFIGSSLFGHHAGELRAAVTSPGVTTIAGDVNGDGVSDFHITLTGNLSLVAADFVL